MTYHIAHLSDLHIGYSTENKTNKDGINLRKMDGYVAFDSLVQQILDDSQIDVAIIAGDIFHNPHPDIMDIVRVQDGLRRLADAGIQVYSIAGNHDTKDVRSDLAASKVIDDPFRGIFSRIDPYVKAEILDGVHLHMVSHHMYSSQASTMKDIKPEPNGINIFMTHGSVIDPLTEMAIKVNASPREIVIPDGLLHEGWDYALLGHIHERGWLRSKDQDQFQNIYYNGSLIRRGFSDELGKYGRGWTKWTINDNGEFSYEFKNVNQRPQIDFEKIDASELSASEITEIVVDRLIETQVSGREFKGRSAPILRQRIENVVPSKQKGIDQKAINMESSHALTWKMAMSFASETEKKEKPRLGEISSGSDMVKIYDGWIEKSSTLQSLDSDIKDEVEEQTRSFIKLGQDKAFEDED